MTEENLKFAAADIMAIKTEYPETWYFINILRLERENMELRGKIHAMGPKPSNGSAPAVSPPPKVVAGSSQT